MSGIIRLLLYWVLGEAKGNYSFCRRNAKIVSFRINEFIKKTDPIEIRIEYYEKVNNYEKIIFPSTLTPVDISIELSDNFKLKITIDDVFWAEIMRSDKIRISENEINIYSKHNLYSNHTLITLREKID